MAAQRIARSHLESGRSGREWLYEQHPPIPSALIRRRSARLVFPGAHSKRVPDLLNELRRTIRLGDELGPSGKSPGPGLIFPDETKMATSGQPCCTSRANSK